MAQNRRSLSAILILVLLSQGCASLTTAAHFTRDSPKAYSGTRLDLHASAHNEKMLGLYKDRYGVEPPPYPKLDLPFSFLFDTVIFFPLVLPVVLYQAVFD
jgi:uncharacterized protein YceK